MLTDLLKNLMNVQKYSDKPVSNEDLEYALSAGRLSSPISGAKSWMLGVIDDKKVIEDISKCCHNHKYIGGAGVLIAICTKRMSDEDMEFEKFRLGKLKDEIYDIDSNVLDIICGREHQSLIAAENIALAACECGMNPHIYAHFDVYKASKVLKIPNSHLVTYLITLGFHGGDGGKTEIAMEEEIVFHNSFM